MSATKNVLCSSCKLSDFLSNFNQTWTFLTDIL